MLLFYDETLESVLDKLEQNSQLAIFWFENNYVKLNIYKYHLLVFGTKYEHIWAKIGEDKIWASNEVKRLGVTIDIKLKFDSHIVNVCFKANQKLIVRLTRLTKCLNLNLSIVLWCGYFVAEQPIIELINYMNLHMMITKPRSRTYSQ